MNTTYVIAYVPAALRSAAESAIAPFLLSPGEVWTRKLSSNSGISCTHYGLCAPLDESGELAANLALLASTLPGGGYTTVSPDVYSRATHWVDWLAGRGLTEFVDE